MELKTTLFKKLVFTVIFTFVWIVLLLWTIHVYIPIEFYKKFFSILTIIIIPVILFLCLTCIFLLSVYKKEKVFLLSPRIGIKLLRKIYPFISAIAAFYNYDRFFIKQLFISINNIFVNDLKLKVSFSDILVLIPHCIQNYNCNIKVTSDFIACKECGKCNISELKKLKNKYGCNLAIATGGTIARKKVKEFNPKYIIAVACERDLISGILDIKSIPVFGLLNERPNGPCINTTVDISKIENQLKKFTMTIDKER